MLPPAVTDAAICSELPGALAWAKRSQIVITTPTKQIIRMVLVQGGEGEKFYLEGNFEDYKELPPVWRWCDESWTKHDGLYLSPKPLDTPFGSSMFIPCNNIGIICAPFNRLAFKTHGGPHKDWGEPAQWMTAGRNYVYAVTIGDMLQSILRDFRFTQGRM